MAKASHSVVAILPRRRHDYFAYWTLVAKDNAGAELPSPAGLTITVDVDARSKTDAEERVRKEYPDHAIDSKATRRHG